MKAISKVCAAALFLLAFGCGSKGGSSSPPGPIPAAACSIAGVPASVTAGDTIAAQVTVLDAQQNVATAYRGTAHVTSSDGAAQLPGDQSWTAADSGTHAVSVRLLTAGNQTFTLTDAANASIACSATVAVQPGAPRLVMTLPADVNAGIATTGTISAQDVFGNPVISYAGTVNLVSSDAAASVPATVHVAEGHALFPVTFATIGAQTVSGVDSAAASISGAAGVRVHGLVYTDPSQPGAAVKLVLNASGSSAHAVQLDLVANRAVPKGFAVGMNLPADATKVVLHPAPLLDGDVFDPGAPPKAEAIRLTAGVLYSGLSQKAAGAGGGKTDVAVAAGGTYYSIRLALAAGATPGTVFDGSAPMRGFRAAVRDLLGDDTVSQRDFAIGKLEVR